MKQWFILPEIKPTIRQSWSTTLTVFDHHTRRKIIKTTLLILTLISRSSNEYQRAYCRDQLIQCFGTTIKINWSLSRAKCFTVSKNYFAAILVKLQFISKFFLQAIINYIHTLDNWRENKKVCRIIIKY